MGWRKFMKKIFLVVVMVFLVQNVSYADEGKGEKFEKKKGKILERINKKRGFLNDFESCVKSADSREGLKTCRKKNKENMQAIRAERKDKKEKRKEKREKRQNDRD